MTQSHPEIAPGDGGRPSPAPATPDYLRRELVVTGLEASSRKRLFEELSALVMKADTADNPLPGQDDIFITLHDRERLGCTALGKGIAVPHGRIDGLTAPVLAIARLQTPVDYDAPDGVPVWLAVCLLAPVEANEVHLNILAGLATRFNDPDFVESVRSASCAEELYALFADTG